jgi:hypothetical protein
MAADCYFQFQGKVVGPVSAAELQRLAAQGAIDGQTLVRRGADGPWIPARRVKGLIPIRPASAAPEMWSQDSGCLTPNPSPTRGEGGGVPAPTGATSLSSATGPITNRTYAGKESTETTSKSHLGRNLGVAALVFGIAVVALGWGVVRPAFRQWKSQQEQLRQLQEHLAALKAAEQPAVPQPRTKPSAAEPAQPQWVDASKGSARQKTVEVGVASVVVGKVRVDSLLAQQPLSMQTCLQITVRIRNHSKSQKLEYSTWNGVNALAAGVNSLLGGASVAADTEAARLTDNFGNHYKLVYFGLGTEVSGQHLAESIYPGKSLTDLLLFEIPVDNFQYLELELPASKIGGKGMLRLRIPRSMVKGMSFAPRAP